MNKLLIYNWAIILKLVKDMDTKTEIHKVSGITYSHVTDYMNIFIDKGFVISKRDGRREILTMTNKGHEVLKTLIKLEQQIQ